MSWRSMIMATAVATSNPRLCGAEDRLELSELDLSAIHALVKAQLAAFSAGDAGAAFDLASDAIRETFGTPERLLDLVRRRYTPLTDPKLVEFGDLVITPEGLAQVLAILDGGGTTHHAVYLIDRDLQGAWRTNGCLLAQGLQAAA